MSIDELRKERLGALYNHKSILYVFKQVGLDAGACKDTDEFRYFIDLFNARADSAIGDCLNKFLRTHPKLPTKGVVELKEFVEESKRCRR